MHNRRRLVCRAAEKIVRAELHGPTLRPEDVGDPERLRARACTMLWLEFCSPIPLFALEGARVAAVIPTGNGSSVKIRLRPVQINRWNGDKRGAELILVPDDDRTAAVGPMLATFATAVIQAWACGQNFAEQVSDLEFHPGDDPESRVWQPCVRPDAPAPGEMRDEGDEPVIQTRVAAA